MALCISILGASEGYRRIIPIAVHAFEGSGVAVLIAVSFVRTFGVSEIGLFALVCAVGKHVASVTLCDWPVFFDVCVIVWDNL